MAEPFPYGEAFHCVLLNLGHVELARRVELLTSCLGCNPLPSMTELDQIHSFEDMAKAQNWMVCQAHRPVFDAQAHN